MLTSGTRLQALLVQLAAAALAHATAAARQLTAQLSGAPRRRLLCLHQKPLLVDAALPLCQLLCLHQNTVLMEALLQAQ